MKQFIMTQGLPGSGKTTWGNEVVEQARLRGTTFVVVNKDDIRSELGGWSKEREPHVVTLRDQKLVAALEAGHSVISTDTNFNRAHKIAFERLARQHNAAFSVKKFPTPVEECIRRDALRADSDRVGRSVIEGMVKQFRLDTDPTWYGEDPTLTVLPYVRTPGLPSIVMSDLDGTLALWDAKGHRGPYNAELCELDDPNPPVLATLHAMADHGYRIVYMSARDEQFRQQTLRWLRNIHAPEGPLFMRPDGDTRKDWVVKSELFEQFIRGRFNVEFVLDDRNQVVDFWRRLGLTVFQVAPGDF